MQVVRYTPELIQIVMHKSGLSCVCSSFI